MRTVDEELDQITRKRVAEMPLLKHLSKRLHFDELLASHIGTHGNEKIPAAQTLLMLVFNITSGRIPLYEMSQWTTDFDGRYSMQTVRFAQTCSTMIVMVVRWISSIRLTERA